MSKIIVVVVLLLTAGFIVTFIEVCGVGMGSGGYDLEVCLMSSSQTPIDAVYCGLAADLQSVVPEEGFKHLKAERFFLMFDPKELCHLEWIRWRPVIRPFGGESFTISVQTATHFSVLLGRELQYQQYFRAIIIVADCKDGKRLVKVQEIPDGRTTRTVSIVLD